MTQRGARFSKWRRPPFSVACGSSLFLALCFFLTAADPSAAINPEPHASASGVPHTDAQLRAMIDEIARSKTLQLNDLDKPYFIRYAISDADQLMVNGSLGGITSSTRLHLRQPVLQVRVGSYNFDNTNSIYVAREHLPLLPLDDDYQALRTGLWLSTDSLYKVATEQINRKRTALREIADPDKTPDLAPAQPIQFLRPPSILKVNRKQWEDAVRQLSARFAAYPEIVGSNLNFRALATTYRLVNTEGTVVRIPENLSDIQIRARGIAHDGRRVWNHVFIVALQPSELPDEQKLAQAVDSVASETAALTKAPLAEEYSGPVLFQQEAAAQMMAEVMADAARLVRKPLAPPGVNTPNLNLLESVWAPRLGSKVTPEWLSIYDDPHQHEFHGHILAGQYDVDDEGVPAQRVSIVDKGVLKGFLLSRVPVNKFNVSNGHGRLPGPFEGEAAAIGNLFVEAAQSVSEAQLKAKLLDKVKIAGLKYGILIRRLDFPSTANLQELTSLARQLQRNGASRTLTVPLLAYRVYPDGREELVRGLRFKEFSAKDLRDVDAASNQPYVLNYVNNGSSLNIADSGGNATSSSVICPSLLFDSIDLDRAEEQLAKPPVVPPPALVAQK